MDIHDILRNKWVQTAAISVISFAGGYILGKRNGVTYVVGTKQVKKPIDAVEEVKDIFEIERVIIVKDPEFEKILDEEERILVENINNPDSYEIAERINKSLEEQRKFQVQQEPQLVNVIVEVDDTWDYDAEQNIREKDIPYILHRDEFFAEEMGFTQETLTYYAGDDIMGDSDDTPIYNYQGLMGELKFGHGSGDPNAVYIRNEKIHMEWEILLDQGMFSQEVLGLTMEEETEEEIRHSYSILKFREE